MEHDMFTHSEKTDAFNLVSEVLNAYEPGDIDEARDLLCLMEKFQRWYAGVQVRLADRVAVAAGVEPDAGRYRDKERETLFDLTDAAWARVNRAHREQPAVLDIDRYGGSLGRVAA